MINGQRLDEAYVTEHWWDTVGPVTLGDGEFWVMGDNRNDSWDSRDFGPVPRDVFDGRMVALTSPSDRASSLGRVANFTVSWHGIAAFSILGWTVATAQLAQRRGRNGWWSMLGFVGWSLGFVLVYLALPRRDLDGAIPAAGKATELPLTEGDWSTRQKLEVALSPVLLAWLTRFIASFALPGHFALWGLAGVGVAMVILARSWRSQSLGRASAVLVTFEIRFVATFVLALPFLLEPALATLLAAARFVVAYAVLELVRRWLIAGARQLPASVGLGTMLGSLAFWVAALLPYFGVSVWLAAGSVVGATVLGIVFQETRLPRPFVVTWSAAAGLVIAGVLAASYAVEPLEFVAWVLIPVWVVWLVRTELEALPMAGSDEAPGTQGTKTAEHSVTLR